MLAVNASFTFHNVLMLMCWPGLLWTVTPKLVWFLFLYAGVGTWITTSAFGKRLMQLHFTSVQREGDLRFDMVRTRENAGALMSDALCTSSQCALSSCAVTIFRPCCTSWSGVTVSNPMSCSWLAASFVARARAMHVKALSSHRELGICRLSHDSTMGGMYL